MPNTQTTEPKRLLFSARAGAWATGESMNALQEALIKAGLADESQLAKGADAPKDRAVVLDHLVSLMVDFAAPSKVARYQKTNKVTRAEYEACVAKARDVARETTGS